MEGIALFVALITEVEVLTDFAMKSDIDYWLHLAVIAFVVNECIGGGLGLEVLLAAPGFLRETY